MLTQAKIDQFYLDVDSLKLKFPNKAISEATGFGKGQVSIYLNKEDEPSENFIDTFYKKFQERLEIVRRGTIKDKSAEAENQKPPLSKEETVIISKTYLDLLIGNSAALRHSSKANSEQAEANRLMSLALLIHIQQSLGVTNDGEDMSLFEKAAPEIHKRVLALLKQEMDKAGGTPDNGGL